MNLKEQAIEKLRKEAENTKHPLSKMLSMQIIDNITDEDRAEKALAEGKSLDGCQKVLDEFAGKRKENNKSFITPDEAEKLIFDYYGFAEATKNETKGEIDVANFL